LEWSVEARGFPNIIKGLKSPPLKSGHHDFILTRHESPPLKSGD